MVLFYLYFTIAFLLQGFGGSYDPQFGALTNPTTTPTGAAPPNHNSYSRAAGNSAFGMYGAAAAAGSAHLAGNSTPGYHTPRPHSGPAPQLSHKLPQLQQQQSSLLSSDSPDRYSGHLQRTAPQPHLLRPQQPPDPTNPSPDTTTKDLSTTAPPIHPSSTQQHQHQQSFLAYSAGGAPPTTATVQGKSSITQPPISRIFIHKTNHRWC